MRATRLTPAFVVLVSMLVVVGKPPTAAATFAGGNGRIAFSYGDQLARGDLGFHTDVFTVRPDGSGLQQLTHVPDDAAAALPSWSPDGTKIAFESNVSGNYEIWVMDADGRDKTQITDEPRFQHLTPSWSPDGTQIVYSRCDMPFGFISSCGIEVMSADGDYGYRVVGGHYFDEHPVFSPDGTSIAFGSDRAGLAAAIWVINVDGTGLRRLTSPNTEGFWPDWSPDGTRILFSNNCCRPHSNLWTVRPDGAGLTRVTDASPHHNEAFGSYSPTGRKIVLTSDEAYPHFCCNDLVVRGADGDLSIIVKGPRGALVFGSWGPAT
jgi:Tol biopolymer transport system component